MTNNDKALAPCPFCGGEAHLQLGHTTEGTDYIRHKGRSGPCGMSDFSNFAEDGSVVDLWNTRTTPQSSADLGKVKVLLEAYRGDRIHPKVNEALAILDQQAAPLRGECPNSGKACSCTDQNNCVTQEDQNPLTALRAKVEGMMKEYPDTEYNKYEVQYVNKHNAALTAVLSEIDNMMKAGE